jgi:hypothetical protein
MMKLAATQQTLNATSRVPITPIPGIVLVMSRSVSVREIPPYPVMRGMIVPRPPVRVRLRRLRLRGRRAVMGPVMGRKRARPVRMTAGPALLQCVLAMAGFPIAPPPPPDAPALSCAGPQKTVQAQATKTTAADAVRHSMCAPIPASVVRVLRNAWAGTAASMVVAGAAVLAPLQMCAL